MPRHAVAALILAVLAIAAHARFADPGRPGQPCATWVAIDEGPHTVLRCGVGSVLATLLACPPVHPIQAGDRLELPPARPGCRTRARPLAATERLALGLPLPLNTARFEELLALPGVGPSLAERIAARRPYRQVDDLLRVRGIGPARLRALRTQVVVGPGEVLWQPP